MAVSMCACAKETDLLTYAQAVLCIFFGWLGFVEVHLSGSREHLRGTEVVVLLCARALLPGFAAAQVNMNELSTVDVLEKGSCI